MALFEKFAKVSGREGFIRPHFCSLDTKQSKTISLEADSP